MARDTTSFGDLSSGLLYGSDTKSILLLDIKDACLNGGSGWKTIYHRMICTEMRNRMSGIHFMEGIIAHNGNNGKSTVSVKSVHVNLGRRNIRIWDSPGYRGPHYKQVPEEDDIDNNTSFVLRIISSKNCGCAKEMVETMFTLREVFHRKPPDPAYLYLPEGQWTPEHAKPRIEQHIEYRDGVTAPEPPYTGYINRFLR